MLIFKFIYILLSSNAKITTRILVSDWLRVTGLALVTAEVDKFERSLETI